MATEMIKSFHVETFKANPAHVNSDMERTLSTDIQKTKEQAELLKNKTRDKTKKICQYAASQKKQGPQG